MEYKMDKQVMAMVGSMGGGESDVPTTSREFLEESDVQSRAHSIGPGVRFVSAEPHGENEKSFGYTAVYAFDDINTITVAPMEGAPNSNEGSFEEENEDSPFTFRFSRGVVSELVVMMDSEDESDEDFETEDANEDQQQNEQMAEMMKPYFRSMAFEVKIEIPGTIQTTNASYREGNTITLINMEMEKIVDNDALFKDVVNSGNIQDDELVSRLEEAGIQIEDQEEVFVRFQ